MRTETTSSPSSSEMPLLGVPVAPPPPLLLPFGGLQAPATTVIVLSACSVRVIPSPSPELSALKNFPDTAPG